MVPDPVHAQNNIWSKDITLFYANLVSELDPMKFQKAPLLNVCWMLGLINEVLCDFN